MSKPTIGMIRKRAARILTDAGYNYVDSPLQYDIATRRPLYIPGAVTINKGAESGFYVAQYLETYGVERNLLGAEIVYSKSELDAWLNGVDCLTQKAYRDAQSN